MSELKFNREIRCPKCHALLAKEYIYKGRIEIKCFRCNELTLFNFKSIRRLEALEAQSEGSLQPLESEIKKKGD